MATCKYKQVLNVCLDVLAEIETMARERLEEGAAAAGGGGGGGGVGHVRATGSGHLRGLAVSEGVSVYLTHRQFHSMDSPPSCMSIQAEAYEAELLEDALYAEGAASGHGHHTYAPHPLIQALVAENDAVARVDLKGGLQGALGAAR